MNYLHQGKIYNRYYWEGRRKPAVGRYGYAIGDYIALTGGSGAELAGEDGAAIQIKFRIGV